MSKFLNLAQNEKVALSSTQVMGHSEKKIEKIMELSGPFIDVVSLAIKNSPLADKETLLGSFCQSLTEHVQFACS